MAKSAWRQRCEFPEVTRENGVVLRTPVWLALSPLSFPFGLSLASSRGLSAPWLEEGKKRKRPPGPRGSAHTPPPVSPAARSRRVREARPSALLHRGHRRVSQVSGGSNPPPPPQRSQLEPRAAPRRSQERPPIPASWLCLHSPAHLGPSARQRVEGREFCCRYVTDPPPHCLGAPSVQMLGKETFSPSPYVLDVGGELANFTCKIPRLAFGRPADLAGSLVPTLAAPSLKCLFSPRGCDLTPGSAPLPLQSPTPVLAHKGWGGGG